MKEKPVCAIKNCKRLGWILFGGQWVCGECLAEYYKKMQGKEFDKINEVLNL